MMDVFRLMIGLVRSVERIVLASPVKSFQVTEAPVAISDLAVIKTPMLPPFSEAIASLTSSDKAAFLHIPPSNEITLLPAMSLYPD